ncbi:shikimate dehydrogenase [Undibacterium flavidum]|uniref:Shikimate dehydrogenase (NADP(+)) n=1 Tax=Undibacterium flavidum TaxID=2762297 RepID=A0ABR6YEC0_9BURK|nr:shikimate dehydrogenase [Undibacterium flavidum]MBC3874862.1 shikimate dehydrogenase [Undibacterium flavidum]
MDHYCVFGNPVHHSKSPVIHAMFAQQTGQNIDYHTRLAPLDGFVEAVRTFIAEGGQGANVTVPFKLEAFALAHQLSERASMAGAVNTLHFVDGKIIADNTDGVGLVRDITCNAATPIRDKRVLLLGAGGAARGALLPLLQELPAVLTIANRTLSKAQELQKLAQTFTSCEVDAVTWQQLEEESTQSFDVIINATSASLQSEVPPIPAHVFGPESLAYDMMYGDTVTSFNQYAQQCGAKTRDGLGMLIEQAAEAFFIWRGVRPNTAEVLAHFQKKGSA